MKISSSVLGAPQVSIPQSAYSVIYGSDTTIPCTILNANPAHFRVTWYYTGSNNQQTTINTGDPSQYSGGVLGNPGLTILNANNQDAGFYKCEAENQVNSGQSSNTQLNVIGGKLVYTYWAFHIFFYLQAYLEDVIHAENMFYTTNLKYLYVSILFSNRKYEMKK